MNSSYVYNRHEWGGNKRIKATYQGLQEFRRYEKQIKCELHCDSFFQTCVWLITYSKNNALKWLIPSYGRKTYLPLSHSTFNDVIFGSLLFSREGIHNLEIGKCHIVFFFFFFSSEIWYTKIPLLLSFLSFLA